MRGDEDDDLYLPPEDDDDDTSDEREADSETLDFCNFMIIGD